MATAGKPEARASCPGTTELGCELVVDSWMRPPFCQLGLNRAECSLGPGHIWDRGLTGLLTPQVDGVGVMVMDTLEEESFALSFSTSDTEFDAVVGFYYHG